jgi:hypothetical protein
MKMNNETLKIFMIFGAWNILSQGGFQFKRYIKKGPQSPRCWLFLTQRGRAATKGKTHYLSPTLSLPLGGGRVGRG